MAQPWPDGDEPGNPGGLEMGTVKADGGECAREWPNGAPGHGYYDPPPTVPPPPYVPALEVTGVQPDHGDVAGGALTDVYGADFTTGGTTTVTFGGAAATSVVVVTPEHLTCFPPAGTAGPADVTVTTPDGSATLPGGYTYELATAPVTAVADFTYTPSNPTTQTMVTFDASASTPGAGQTITSYAWLFNNSATRSGVTCTWRLPSGHGEYDAQLTITDSGSATDSLTQVITI
jgi:hypothetical protein